MIMNVGISINNSTGINISMRKNMMIRIRSTVCISITREFRTRTSTCMNNGMNFSSSITVTMRSSVRRSNSIQFNTNNSTMISTYFQTCWNMNANLNINRCRDSNLSIRLSFALV